MNDCIARPLLLIAVAALAVDARATEPKQVRPSTGTIWELRAASAHVATTIGDSLDKGHDWLYRRLEHWIENTDTRYGSSDAEHIVVPLSPLRVGYNVEIVHGNGGFGLLGTPDLEATVRLPNIERRLRLFITSSDIQESPTDPARAPNPVRLGVRVSPHTAIDFELGVRLKVWPVVFAAWKWAPTFHGKSLTAYPFAKAYVESGMGIGVSSGITLERWRGRWVTRSASYADWVRNTTNTSWTQSLLAGYAPAIIQERRYGTVAAGHDLACGAAVKLSASGDRLSRVQWYEGSVLIKRPLHGGWLFGYVEPLLHWDRAHDWHPDLGVRIGFDALFWGLAKRPAEVASLCR